MKIEDARGSNGDRCPRCFGLHGYAARRCFATPDLEALWCALRWLSFAIAHPEVAEILADVAAARAIRPTGRVPHWHHCTRCYPA